MVMLKFRMREKCMEKVRDTSKKSRYFMIKHDRDKGNEENDER